MKAKSNSLKTRWRELKFLHELYGDGESFSNKLLTDLRKLLKDDKLTLTRVRTDVVGRNCMYLWHLNEICRYKTEAQD